MGDYGEVGHRGRSSTAVHGKLSGGCHDERQTKDLVDHARVRARGPWARRRSRSRRGAGRGREPDARGQRQVGPQDRLDGRHRQPEPAHRLDEQRLRDLRPGVPPHGRAGLGDPQARRLGDRQELGGHRRRTRMDLHPERGHDVARRRAHHGAGRRLHLQLHHRERDRRLHQLRRWNQPGRGRRRPHLQGHLRQARRQHAHALDPLSARAHLGQDERQGGEPDLPERPALHRQRPLPGRRVEEGALPADGGLQGLLPRRADGRRAHLRRLPERRHHGPGPEGRHARRRLSLPAGAVRAARSDRRRRGHRVQLVQLGLRRVQLLRRRVKGQPGPARQGLPSRPGMGGGPREDGRAGLRWPCVARLHLHAAGQLE